MPFTTMQRLLGLYRGRRDDLALLQLRATNDLPSESQRRHLNSRLQILEAEFARRTGVLYSAYHPLGADGLTSPKARRCYAAIEEHRSLLSCFRDVPPEILQHIFSFVAFSDAPDSPHGRAHRRASLFAVCSVSRDWRLAAITSCALWTHLPSITIDNRPSEGRSALFDLYLSRSGTLPLTLTVSMWDTVGGEVEPDGNTGSKAFDSLLSLCHRWGSANFTLPLGLAWEYLLSRVRGNVPLLSRLEIKFGFLQAQGNGTPLPTFNYFSDAPRLKHVELTCEYSDTGPVIDLPWSQLEIMHNELGKNAGPTYYSLLSSQSANLESLHCNMTRRFWRELSRIPTDWIPCLLPNLTKLSLLLEFTTENELIQFANHMDVLSLPSLNWVSLSIGAPSLPEPFKFLSDQLASLIRRSKCDIRTLVMVDQQGAYTPDTLLTALLLCPNLTTLEIPKATPDFIRRLTLDATSSVPVLPCLTSLTIHCDWSEGEKGVPVQTLMDLVLSRTQDLTPPLHTFRRLEEVFLDTVNLSLFQDDMTEWGCEYIIQGSPVVNVACRSLSGQQHAGCKAMLRIAQEVVPQLHRYWNAICENKVYLHVHMETDRVLRRLEKVTVEETTMSTFYRVGVVRQLVNIYWAEVEDVGLRKSILQMQERVQLLLTEWKATLVRSAKICPYLWRVAGGTSGFEYHQAQEEVRSIHLVCRKIGQRDESIEDDAIADYLAK